MNNRVKSLEIRNEVIKLIEDKFEMKFSYGFNDLYKVKDNNLVRRLKGNLFRKINGEIIWWSKDEKDLFNDLVLEINSYLNDLKYEGFEVRLKKKVIEISERDRNYFEERNNIIIDMKEYKKYRMENEKELILSIVFKDI